MSKIYKVKINQGQGKSSTLDVPPAAGLGKPVTIKAAAGERYQLVDPATGYAPENIRVARSGKDLKVFFEGRNVADLVVEDYYAAVTPGFNAMVGEAENGRAYEYIPESASGDASVPSLADGGSASGLALGGSEVSPAGAAVGALVAAAGFPWLLGAAGAAGLAAAAGGGGGGGSTPSDTTPPVVKSAKLLVDDDSGPKDNVTKLRTPRITGETEANANVSVEVNGKTYTGKADANGVFTIPVTDSLADATYTPLVTATDAAGNKSQPFAGTPFKVDNSSSSNGAEADANVAARTDIVSISDDTGSSNADFYTKDNTLAFKGTVSTFTNNGDWVALVLKDASGKVVDSGYAKPELVNGVWSWAWDRTTAAALTDGSYTLEASVVDGAGNPVSNGTTSAPVDTQVIVVDTDSAHNIDPSRSPEKQADVNVSAKIALSAVSDDTGHDARDFITSDRTLKFAGTINGFQDNGDWVQVTLKDAQGNVVATDHVKPTQANGNTVWEWDQTARALPDGKYSLDFSIVDKAGNVLNSGTQAVVVDNSPSHNAGVADPNAGLKLGAVAISDDTGLVGDLVTRDRTLTFSGTLDKPFTDNGDRLLVQVFGLDGKVVSQQYVKPSGTSWSFQNLTELGSAEGLSQYTVSTSLVDAAGNTLKSTDQTFQIDTYTTITEKSAVDKGSSAWVYSVVNFSAAERGQYSFTVGGQTYTREYTGGVFDMKEVLNKTFAAGQFSLTFTDLSGNAYTLSNTAVAWDFSKASMGTADASMPALLPATGFNGTIPVGSVGKLVLQAGADAELDLSSLYSAKPASGDVTAVNHIDARTGDHVIKLTMGDVLALGVKDSFSVATAHKGHLQLRIDGDAKDTLKLDDLVGTTEHTWNTNQSMVTLGGKNYKVFSNEELGLDLFVEAEIRIDGP